MRPHGSSGFRFIRDVLAYRFVHLVNGSRTQADARNGLPKPPDVSLSSGSKMVHVEAAWTHMAIHKPRFTH